jgi:hypothetical protein
MSERDAEMNPHKAMIAVSTATLSGGLADFLEKQPTRDVIGLLEMFAVLGYQVTEKMPVPVLNDNESRG